MPSTRNLVHALSSPLLLCLLITTLSQLSLAQGGQPGGEGTKAPGLPADIKERMLKEPGFNEAKLTSLQLTHLLMAEGWQPNDELAAGAVAAWNKPGWRLTLLNLKDSANSSAFAATWRRSKPGEPVSPGGPVLDDVLVLGDGALVDITSRMQVPGKVTPAWQWTRVLHTANGPPCALMATYRPKGDLDGALLTKAGNATRTALRPIYSAFLNQRLFVDRLLHRGTEGELRLYGLVIRVAAPKGWEESVDGRCPWSWQRNESAQRLELTVDMVEDLDAKEIEAAQIAGYADGPDAVQQLVRRPLAAADQGQGPWLELTFLAAEPKRESNWFGRGERPRRWNRLQLHRHGRLVVCLAASAVVGSDFDAKRFEEETRPWFSSLAVSGKKD